MSHSPGPWKFHLAGTGGDRGMLRAWSADGAPVIDAIDVRYADAKLLAAAPELLAMLRELGEGSDDLERKLKPRVCPLCGRFQSLGAGAGNHAPGCRLAELLGRFPK